MKTDVCNVYFSGILGGIWQKLAVLVNTASIFRTVADNEKTVGVAASASCSVLYENFPLFKSEVKTFETG